MKVHVLTMAMHSDDDACPDRPITDDTRPLLPWCIREMTEPSECVIHGRSLAVCRDEMAATRHAALVEAAQEVLTEADYWPWPEAKKAKWDALRAALKNEEQHG